MVTPLLTSAQQRQLMEQARQGEGPARDEALRALLADFRAPALAAIHKALAAAGVGAVHAEEALQEAVLKLLTRGLDRFEGRASPRTYFVRIAINAALDQARRQARLRPLPGRGEQEAGGPPADAALAARRRRAALQACIAELATTYRQPIQLYYLDEAGDCATCAGLLGISRACFMQRLSRARLMLGDCLRRKDQRGGAP